MILSFDLGTGGLKASLYGDDLRSVSEAFISYETLYPESGYHEQRPEEWWGAVKRSAKKLIKGRNAKDIKALALSGQSLATVPIDEKGKLLKRQIPIWSDRRAGGEAKKFFGKVSETAWYKKTGSGFPAECYSIFKLMHLKKTEPDIFGRIHKVLGSKDFINYKLTGKIATDPSYASGCGAYDLKEGAFDERLFKAAGLDAGFFPKIFPSHKVIGEVTKEAAEETGLAAGTKVVCGGVDNACMAMGSVTDKIGGVYLSLGSSAWIAANAKEPIIDAAKKPYTFAHINGKIFTSAYSIFSAGTSVRWLRDTLLSEIAGAKDAFERIDGLAKKAAAGSGGVIFNPSLAGGTSQDKKAGVKGAFLGLTLDTGKEEIARAVLEGVALNLKHVFEMLEKKVDVKRELLICGGGSKSPFWMQMFADVFNMPVYKTNVDQNAASLGAAAAAAKGVGLIKNYSYVERLHTGKKTYKPDAERAKEYAKIYKRFKGSLGLLARF